MHTPQMSHSDKLIRALIILYCLALAIGALDEIFHLGLFPTKLEHRVNLLVKKLADEGQLSSARSSLKTEPEFVVIPALLRALDSRNPRIRKESASLLVELTGEDFGFDPSAPKPHRDEVISLWKKWWEENKSRF